MHGRGIGWFRISDRLKYTSSYRWWWAYLIWKWISTHNIHLSWWNWSGKIASLCVIIHTTVFSVFRTLLNSWQVFGKNGYVLISHNKWFPLAFTGLDVMENYLLTRVTKLVTLGFPSQRASNAENISIWWRHHVLWNVQKSKTQWMGIY